MKDRYLEQISLAAFLILTPSISIAIAVFSSLPPELIALSMAFVPAVMAVLLAGIGVGRKGIRSLLQRLVQCQVGFKWYVLALGIPLGVHLAMSLLALWLRWISSIQIRPWSPLQLIIIGLVMIVAATLEELGWRGFALPKLLVRRSMLFSALIIGFFWGVLHLPLSAPGMVNAGVPWPAAMLIFTGFSVILTWLFIQSSGSLIITILCHFGMNYFTVFNEGISAAETAWLQAFLILIVAIVLLLLHGTNLAREALKKTIATDAA